MSKARKIRDIIRIGGSAERAAKLYKSAKATNRAGGKAWAQDLKEKATQLLLTGILGKSFYRRKQDEQVLDAVPIFKELITADPDFAAALVIYTRQEAGMRHLALLLTAALSSLEDKRYIERTLPNVLRTPKDAYDYIQFCKSGAFRKGLGTKNKELLNIWISEKISEYWGIKYRNQLEYVIRQCHPKPTLFGTRKTAKRELVEWLMNGHEIEFDLLPKVTAFEELKERPDKAGEILSQGGDLPHEIVTGTVTSMQKRDWEALLPLMPALATLRNINTVLRAGVSTEDVWDNIEEKLTPQRVKAAKIFPFQIFSAIKAVIEAKSSLPGGVFLSGVFPFGGLPYGGRDIYSNLWFSKRLSIVHELDKVLENTFSNAPELPGKGAIFIDISGSMKGTVGRSKMSYCEIGAIFMHFFKKANPGTDIYTFNTDAAVLKGEPITTAAEAAALIRRLAKGGTDLGSPVRLIRTSKLKYDWFIGITDDQEWFNNPSGFLRGSSGLAGELLRYRELVNRNVKFIGLRIDPYIATRSIPEITDKDTVIYGYGDHVFKLADYVFNKGRIEDYIRDFARKYNSE
jgi:60 kDa SS-A/Ro ribonucleoprotein